jgi:hypothetical protein
MEGIAMQGEWFEEQTLQAEWRNKDKLTVVHREQVLHLRSATFMFFPKNAHLVFANISET